MKGGEINMKKYFNVEFSYNIQVEATSEDEAEEKALKEYISIDPLTDELNIKINETDKNGKEIKS